MTAISVEDHHKTAITFSAINHARMLSDGVRLSSYGEAIKRSVLPGSCVVDIGAGTGILTHLALCQNAKKVWSIEVSEGASWIAKKLFAHAGYDKVEVLNNSSFDVCISDPIDVLISETLGFIGIEEGIVEIMHDFCKRHPRIKRIIPFKLEIGYEWFYSDQVEEAFDEYMGIYNKVSKSFKFDFQPIFRELELAYCNLLRMKYLDRIEYRGQKGLIQSYELGKDNSSYFAKGLKCSEPRSKVNALHIYFKASLCDGICLSNHFSEARTHWHHVYLRKPDFCNELELSYCPKRRKIQAGWKGC